MKKDNYIPPNIYFLLYLYFQVPRFDHSFAVQEEGFQINNCADLELETPNCIIWGGERFKTLWNHLPFLHLD
jgi:hypothetical protein